MSRHPDILEIDACRRGEAAAEAAGHLRTCTECRATLADLEALDRQLKLVAEPHLGVPEVVEQRILWQARKRALAVRRRRHWRRGGTWAAAAALVLVGLASILRAPSNRGDRQLEVAAKAAAPAAAVRVAAADVDGDGRVDILDAFALARQVETHRSGADVNGDGVVDGADVEAVAARAVSLGGA